MIGLRRCRTPVFRRKRSHSPPPLPLQSGDAVALEQLRASIESRIDELESFYVQHVDDERGVLFEKQRLKLRKLLHSHDAAAASGGAGGATETQRMTLTELMAWFLRDGHRELPAMTEDHVAVFFNSLAPRSRDGKVSVAEMRQWYNSSTGPGGQAELAARDAATSGDAGGDTGDVGSSGSAAGDMMSMSGARKLEQAGTRKKLGLDKDRRNLAARKSAAAGRKKKKPKKAVYGWEKAKSATGSSADTDADVEPVGLQGMLEFQVRLTPAEYREYSLRRRNKQAEQKHFARSAQTIALREARAPKHKDATTTLASATPYSDPAASQTNIFRSVDKTAWISDRGFDSNMSPTREKRPAEF